MGITDDEEGNRRDLVETGVETGSAVVGALVGFALGGPLGAAIGAAAPPLAVRTSTVLSRAWARRQLRAERTMQLAIVRSGLSESEVVGKLESSDDLADHLLSLIALASDTDPQLASALSQLVADSLRADEPRELERLRAIAVGLRGLTSVQIEILRALRNAGGELSAAAIAAAVAFPELELRGAVRDLELRGMIKDLGDHPVVWRLRELGTGIVRFADGRS